MEKSTEIISTELQSKVQSGLNIVKKRLSEIKEMETSPVKTSNVFKWNPYTTSSGIRIDQTTDVPLLLCILGYIQTKSKEYNLAADSCKLNQFPVFSWCGYKLEDWEHDLKQRISMLTAKEEKNRLYEIKRELESYQSKEQKLQDFLNNLNL